MNWIDRINAAILRRLTGATTLLADEQGLERSGRRYLYTQLQRAVAYRQSNWVGDALCVALDFGDGQILVVSDTDEVWRSVLASLDANSRSQRRSAEWSLALIAGPEGTRIELL